MKRKFNQQITFLRHLVLINKAEIEDHKHKNEKKLINIPKIDLHHQQQLKQNQLLTNNSILQCCYCGKFVAGTLIFKHHNSHNIVLNEEKAYVFQLGKPKFCYCINSETKNYKFVKLLKKHNCHWIVAYTV